jgi:hypothetical protein
MMVLINIFRIESETSVNNFDVKHKTVGVQKNYQFSDLSTGMEVPLFTAIDNMKQKKGLERKGKIQGCSC